MPLNIAMCNSGVIVALTYILTILVRVVIVIVNLTMCARVVIIVLVYSNVCQKV